MTHRSWQLLLCVATVLIWLCVFIGLRSCFCVCLLAALCYVQLWFADYACCWCCVWDSMFLCFCVWFFFHTCSNNDSTLGILPSWEFHWHSKYVYDVFLISSLIFNFTVAILSLWMVFWVLSSIIQSCHSMALSDRCWVTELSELPH